MSSAAEDVNVKVTVTFPESFNGVLGLDSNLDLRFSESASTFSLSCWKKNTT